MPVYDAASSLEIN